MSAQDDQDWLDLLAGKSVSHADPNTVREARIFRAALLAYADKEKVGKVEESYSPILAKVLNRLETEGYLQKAEPASTMSVDSSLAQIPPTPPFSKGGIEIFSFPVTKKTTAFQQYDPLLSLAASLLIAVLIVVSQLPGLRARSQEPCVNNFVEPPQQTRIIPLQRELKALGITSKIIQLKNGFRLKATLPTDRSPALQSLLARYDHLIVLPESQYLCVNFLAKETQ
jgi:hypothetical protein